MRRLPPICVLLLSLATSTLCAQTKPAAWNAHARQFIDVPSFDFAPAPGAATYRFTLRCADGRERSFEAATPNAALTEVWADVPVGTTTLKVEAVVDGSSVAVGERTFHRAAPFRGPYAKPALPYDQSARVALESVTREPFVRSWLDTGKPDPSYPLYRYAAKVVGSLAGGCATYAMLDPRPPDADDAIAIGRRAADFLIGVSAPAGTPLEFFPPTYHDATPTERENDAWTMLMTPAEAAQGYLDLYDATRDPKYFDAATHVADTYVKLQLDSGTWPLKVDNRTGKAIADVELIPAEVIRFLDRLVTRHAMKQYQPMLERAVRWTLENPARTFDWRAQFDDAKVRGPYENLAKHEACLFAGYLFARREHIELANEILRFAEDQFVVWADPPTIPRRKGLEQLDPRHWITPCSTEQYAMFEPISGSSAFMIVAYVRAYEATHNPTHLAKARSLANALTVAQQKHGGRYPTRMIEQDLAYWVNSTVNTARAMILLAKFQ